MAPPQEGGKTAKEKARKQARGDTPPRIILRLGQPLPTASQQGVSHGGSGDLLPVSTASSEQPRASGSSSDRAGVLTARYLTRSSGYSLESLVRGRADAYGEQLRLNTTEELVEAISKLHKTPSPTEENRADQKSNLTAAGQHTKPENHQDSTQTPEMTTRNKPRQGYAAKEDQGDSQEEQALWNQIQADLRKCATIQKKQSAHAERIHEIQEIINKNPNAPAKLYEEADMLTREILKLTQEELKLLNEEPTDIRRNIEILQALRAASSNDGRAASPAGRSAKDKQRKHKGSGSGGASGGRLDGPDALDSPGPSPIAGGRLKNSVRSSSVALGRESRDVKMEDGDAGGRSAIASEGSKGPSAEKAGKFFVGAEVAYKQAKPKEDGSQWIQCTILSITERNGKKRYEVQDPEPDETGAPGDIYTASASALIAIPPAEADLGELPVGKPVLARYPETTTFYRAEVTGFVASRGLCRLKFEDDQNQEMEVDRRFVLSLER